MVEYKCERCNKIFFKKSQFIYHSNRKNPCKEILPKENSSDLLDQLDQLDLTDSNAEYKINSLECQYCHSTFSQKSSLGRHIKDRCKIKNKENRTKQILSEMVKQITTLKTELEKVKKTTANIELNNEKSSQELENLKTNSLQVTNIKPEQIIVQKYKPNKRTRQNTFRKDLIERYSKCVITGHHIDMTSACHIKPYCQCSNDELYDVDNGIILDSGLHNLFDKNVISINPLTCEVEVNDSHRDHLEQYAGKKVEGLNEKTLKFLEFHYKIFIQNKTE